jgi:hypothetical protein
VLTEFAITVPFLLTLVFSFFAVAKLLQQITWFATTSYESVIAGGKTNETVGEREIVRINQLFSHEQNRDEATLSLTHTFFEENDAGGNAVAMVEVKLSGGLNFSTGAIRNAGVSVGFVGPHVGKNSGIYGEADFQTYNGPYNCSGVKCGGGGGEPSCPSAPC